jgi:hypothetical protein
MLRVTWKDKIRNIAIIEKMKVTRRLMDEIRERKMKYCGHVLRHNTMQRTLLEGRIAGKRSQGKQRLTWWDNIKQWTGRTYKECARLSQKREEWRFMAVNLRLGDDT